jgi:PPOX class probable F420-dependent enzyme
MTTPTVPESHGDLTQQRVGILSTIGASGRPQSTAIWFLLDDDGMIRTSVTTDRQKYKNMAARPVATLFVLDPANPYRTLEIRGDVTFDDDPDLAFMDRIVRRYGMDPATFPGVRENRVVLTLTPSRIVANG